MHVTFVFSTMTFEVKITYLWIKKWMLQDELFFLLFLGLPDSLACLPVWEEGCLSGHQTQTPVPTQSGPLTHWDGLQPWSQTTILGLSYAAPFTHSSSLTLGDHPFTSGFILVLLAEFGDMVASNPILQMSRGNGSKLFCNLLHRARAGQYIWDPERGWK